MICSVTKYILVVIIVTVSRTFYELGHITNAIFLTFLRNRTNCGNKSMIQHILIEFSTEIQQNCCQVM